MKNIDLGVQKRGRTCLYYTSDFKSLFYLFEGSLYVVQPQQTTKNVGKKRKKQNYPGLSLLFIRGMLTQGIVVRYLGRDAGLGFQQVLPVLCQIFDLAHEVDGQAAALGEGSEVFLT